MTKPIEERAREVLNSSGYLFQLRVEHEIKSSQSTFDREGHEFSVLGREHPWWHGRDLGRLAFVDLLLAQGRAPECVMIVECKKTRDGVWVFPSRAVKNGRRVVALRLLSRFGSPTVSYEKIDCYPEAHEAEFCAIRGTGEDQTSTAERLSVPLVSAAEAIAMQVVKIEPRDPDRETAYYFVSVIVTNSKLMVCVSPSADVSLETGELPVGDFREVDWVRFHKTLAAVEPEHPKTLEQFRLDAERTVFIVNASSLSVFLQLFRVCA